MAVSQDPSGSGGALRVGSQTVFLLGVNREPISASRTSRGQGVVSPSVDFPLFDFPWMMAEMPVNSDNVVPLW
jgi:hypothetical protein